MNARFSKSLTDSGRLAPPLFRRNIRGRGRSVARRSGVCNVCPLARHPDCKTSVCGGPRAVLEAPRRWSTPRFTRSGPRVRGNVSVRTSQSHPNEPAARRQLIECTASSVWQAEQDAAAPDGEPLLPRCRVAKARAFAMPRRRCVRVCVAFTRPISASGGGCATRIRAVEHAWRAAVRESSGTPSLNPILIPPTCRWEIPAARPHGPDADLQRKSANVRSTALCTAAGEKRDRRTSKPISARRATLIRFAAAPRRCAPRRRRPAGKMLLRGTNVSLSAQGTTRSHCSGRKTVGTPRLALRPRVMGGALRSLLQNGIGDCARGYNFLRSF